jgi:hypothetical protein
MAEEPDSLEQRLMAAAAAGNVDDINALLQEGADPSYQDVAEGVSPLMRAAENGHLQAAVALLEGGAPWNAQDKEGYTAGKPADLACHAWPPAALPAQASRGCWPHCAAACPAAPRTLLHDRCHRLPLLPQASTPLLARTGTSSS